jgi:hypothetical protein
MGGAATRSARIASPLCGLSDLTAPHTTSGWSANCLSAVWLLSLWNDLPCPKRDTHEHRCRMKRAAARFQPIERGTRPETKKPAAGGGAAGFSKRTEQRLGGGVPPFLQTSLGGGAGRLKLEALREEVHHFDGANHTPDIEISYSLCCTAAMQEIQIGKARDEAGSN